MDRRDSTHALVIPLKAFLFAGASVLLLATSTSPSVAFPSIGNQWQSIYDTVDGRCGFPSQTMQAVLDASGTVCQVCHVNSGGGSPWNSYGSALKQSGSDFTGIERNNSDNDAGVFTNIDEICGDTQPGWTMAGQNFAFDANGQVIGMATSPAVTSDPDPTANHLPLADAGADQVVEQADTVNLDGSGSSDADADPLDYAWALTVPAGSTAILSDPTAEQATFVADLEGFYTATLTVNDGTADSPADEVTVVAQVGDGNTGPTADAGPAQTVAPGALVTLDGSASADPDNDPLSYAWSLTVPAGSSALLSDPAAQQPTFTADIEGIYRATLVVSDGSADSASATVKVTARELLTIDDPIESGIDSVALPVDLVVLADGLVAPNYGTFAPGLPTQLFVTDQPGVVHAIHVITGATTQFLDVSGFLATLQPLGGLGARDFIEFDERGLLGIAFHPQFQSIGRFYTYTSEGIDGPADFPLALGLSATDQAAFEAAGLTFPNHQAVIREWVANNPADPGAGATLSRVVMRIDQPQFNHNGGALAFDQTGMLLIALGDGGGADDSPEPDEELFIDVPLLGHGQSGNAQNPANVLGSILRINPLGDNASGGQYGIPDDNPFVVPGAVQGGEVGCADGLCDEILAYGFRNPFRLSVDRVTGAILVGDVGQNDIEEVDIVVSGANYGWKLKEGTFLFDTAGPGAGTVYKASPGIPSGFIEPVAEYDHDEGVSVIGGFVYRGPEVPTLNGIYLFGEYTRPPFDPDNLVCAGRLFFLGGAFAAGVGWTGAGAGQSPSETFRELQPITALGNRCVLGFGQDLRGEVFVLVNETGIASGSTGAVLRLARP